FEMLDTKPTRTGINAPPIIAVHKKPDVASELAVERSKVRVKITGNIIELNNPIANATKPAPTPPMEKIYTHMAEANPVKTASNIAALTFASSADPIKRPTIAPPQYMAVIAAASCNE